MKFIKTLIAKIVRWAVNEQENEQYAMRNSHWPNIAKSKYTLGSNATIDQLDDHSNLSFTVYSANGGKIIQIKNYNQATDSWKSTLYVITNLENLGDEIAQILTVESLSR